MVSNFQQTNKQKKGLGRKKPCGMTAIMLENSTAPFSPSYRDRAMTLSQLILKNFLKRNLQRDSNLECKFDDQFQMTIQLQLPINSIPKTKRTIVNI